MMEGYCEYIYPDFKYDTNEILTALKENNLSKEQTEFKCVLAIFCIYENDIFKGLPVSNEIQKLYATATDKCYKINYSAPQDVFYKEMFEVLKEMCVLFNNIYISLSNNTSMVAYHTPEINIDNVIRMLELISGYGYIYPYNQASYGVYYNCIYENNLTYVPEKGGWQGPTQDNFRFWYYKIAYLELMLLATYEHDKELEKKYGFE